MAEVKILDVRQLKATDPARQGKFDRVVFAQIDGARIEVVRVPEEAFSEQAVIAAIKKRLEEGGKLTGKTFTV